MDELARKASELASSFPVRDHSYLPESSRALVISYRNLGILPAANGKQFVWDHLVRLLAARYLVSEGWKRESVADLFKTQSAGYLAEHMAELPRAEHTPNGGDTGQSQMVETTAVAVRLLAAGIVEQFGLAKRGLALVQDNSMSDRLAQAMLLLAGLFLREGRDNPLGSVHKLLTLCCLPLTKERFGLEVLGHREFPYVGLVLIDPDRRIPTLDCAELARQAYSEFDIREQLAFEALRSASEQFIGRRDDAYALMRLWITENPVATTSKLRSFVSETNLQAALGFLQACYEYVGPRHFVNGQLHVCSTCGVPMQRSRSINSRVACTTVQCSAFDKPVESVAQIADTETVIARPHILQYWVGPGLDEAAVYRRAEKLGLSPIAYPGRDACDISLEGDTVGVDIKSYANPFVLAAALTEYVGGLANYRTRIIAINDQVLARYRGYLDIVRQRYSGPLPLRFMSVEELKNSLEIPF